MCLSSTGEKNLSEIGPADSHLIYYIDINLLSLQQWSSSSVSSPAHSYTSSKCLEKKPTTSSPWSLAASVSPPLQPLSMSRCSILKLIATVEWIGYIGRAIGHFNQWELGTFIMQDLLLLVAPALFAASIYMVLGRLIIFTQGEMMAPIRPTRLTKLFVSGDCLAFVVQASG